MKNWQSAGALRGVVLAVAFSMVAMICLAADGLHVNTQKQNAPAAAAHASFDNSGLFLEVKIEEPLKLKVSKLKPGDIVEGKIERDVYSSDHKVFDAGTTVRLPVDHLEKRRRIPNDHWPGVVKLFTPRHENYPLFKTATVYDAGKETPLQVSLIDINRLREVHAQAKKKGSGPQAGNVEVSQAVVKTDAKLGPKLVIPPTIILEAVPLKNQEASSANAAIEGILSAKSDGSGLDVSNVDVPNLDVPNLELPSGTTCKIILLGDVSASKSKPGDLVQARVIEPVLLNGRLALPAGTLIEGKVVKKTPPKWGSRAGALALTFTGVTLPGGNLMPISASLAGAELDQRSHTKIDSEGQLHGEHPGKAWMAINIGVTAGIAKEADDTLQLIIEAIVSTATDASTAGVGRIAATVASGIYMVSRKGRDVVLPRFTEMEIALDRPLSVRPAQPAGSGN
jgi:hypothetical protein